MSADAQHNPAVRRSSRRISVLLITTVALVAAGLFAWNNYFRSVRYEIDLDQAQLFTGSVDTMRLTGFGVNRAGGRVPFSRPRIEGDIVEGASLGRIERDGDGLRFISHGLRDGEVTLRIVVESWPFPMLVSFRIHAAFARILQWLRRDPGDEMTHSTITGRRTV